ncbi:MAG: 30S ribosomal protein S8 [Candidatus Omnitrophota bacterium]|nr:30S ribosomal protein S8 [Candidatus Omnitrophota bacterium]
MSKTDPIADFLTIIRNGLMAKKENVDVLASRITKSILEILKKTEYIDNFKLIEDKKQGILRVYLKYSSGEPAIINLRRISKPGLRVYVKQGKIPRVLRGRGIAVISTSKGILTDNEARQEKLGGEVICYVW